MFGWIKDKITEPLQEMILESINNFFLTILDGIIDGISGILFKEMELIGKIFEQPYFVKVTEYAQILAFTLLAVRVAYSAFQQYILYSDGQESNPTQLLKDTIFATIIITSVPWIVKTVFLFSMGIVDDLMGLSPVTEITSLTTVLANTINPTNIVLFLILVLIAGFLMILFVLFQIAARAVLVGLLMVVGPLMWAFKNELGNVWFRAVWQACLAMPLQMFLIRGALGMLTSFLTEGNFMFGMMLFIGFLWTAIKTPQFLQQWVASTGVGGAVGGAASSAGQMVILRRIMRK